MLGGDGSSAVATGADPTRALIRWLHAIEVPGVVVLACSHAAPPVVPDTAVGVVVDGCIADVGLSLPAQLLACGVSEILVGACPERPDDAARTSTLWSDVFGTVRPAPDDARPRRRHAGPVFDLRSPAVSRRSLFGLRSHAVPPFDLSGDDVARGVEAMRILRDGGRARLDASAAGPSDRAGVAIDADGCTACGVCVRACPEGAMALTHEGGVSTLLHRHDSCRADRVCIRLCPEAALRVTAELSTVDLLDDPLVVLATVATVVCSRCGTRHPSSDGPLCPTCRFRRTNPFGSGAPRGR